MMFSKVNNQVFICSLKFHFDGKFEHLYFSGAAPDQDQRFYESIHKSGTAADPSYFSSGSFSFTETSQESDAGTFYRQEAAFRFPSNDKLRSQRIEKLKQLKYLEMILNDGSSFVMGRNDIDQNAKPVVRTQSNFHLTEVRLSTDSILPVSPLFVFEEGGPNPLLGYDYTYNFELS